MTFKEQIINQLIEVNNFGKGVIALVQTQSSENKFEIAERAAHNVVTDHPSITELETAVQKAIDLMMFIDLGYVPEQVGSSV